LTCRNSRKPSIPHSRDSGDHHLHPNDLGYRHMADSIDMALFAALPVPVEQDGRLPHALPLLAEQLIEPFRARRVFRGDA
jgi:hypothetical protein